MTSATAPPPAAPSEDAARSPQEALAAPVKLEGPGPHPTAGLRLAAFLAALAAHATVLYWIAPKPPDPTAGARGVLPAAVNVTLVSSVALEAREVDPARPPAPPAADMVDATDGTRDSIPVPQQRKVKKPEVSPDRSPPYEPVPAGAILEEPPRVAEREHQQANVSERLGAAAARGEAPATVKRIAPAAASPGAVRDYASAVAAALARTKPKRVPAYGKLKVKLVVSPEGGVAELEIIESSGNRRLDDKVLAEVRRAKLPVPPPGLTLQERWYEFVYTFDR